ncbi:MAG: hypothetical protein AAGF87_03840 [Bacteroidota bacterium]
MNIIKRTLPILLLFSLFYGAWYYWQSRPVDPVTGRVLQLEAEEVERMHISPAASKAFSAIKEIDSWLLNDGDRHLVEASKRPDSLLQALLMAESIDLIDADSLGPLFANLELFTKSDDVYQLSLFCVSADDCRNACLQIVPRPEVFLMADLNLAELPLAFNDYRNRTIFDLEPLGRLDSLVWLSDSGLIQQWYRPEYGAKLDSLAMSPKVGAYFADQFDEISHQNRYWGSYHIYGARNDAELRVYVDSQWTRPLVIWSTQFNSAYFSLDSLSQIGLPESQTGE